METESLSDLFRRLDARNRENVALAGLGIRTSADIFEAIQNQYEHSSGQRIAACGGTVDSPALANLGIRTSTDILEALNGENGRESGDVSSQRRHRPHQTSGTVSSGQSQIVGGAKDTVGNGSQEQSRHGNELKRSGPRGNDGQLPRKRTRTVGRQERSQSEEADDLADVLRVLEEEFAEKERLSDDQTWCMPVSHERKVKTVEEFYKAFHDVRTLPVLTCMFCYRKHSRAELQYVDWDWWVANAIEKRDGSPFKCVQCFPVGQKILGCADCVRHLGRGALSAAARLHTQLGCEHMFPDELKDLTPVEEKLIALNSCYGFITKHSVSDGHRQGATYPRHVKGHITVFPNNVQELATNVLPHPLLKVMDDVHISWQGQEKPAPSDLSTLLSVRRNAVEKALLWLKRYNPLYADIEIDEAELDSWDAPSHGVPSQVFDRLERNEPSARGKMQTAHIVPPTERDIDDHEPVDIQEIMASLAEGLSTSGEPEVDGFTSGEDGDDWVGNNRDRVDETESSGMFNLDGRPDIPDAEKLRYLVKSMGEVGPGEHTHGSTWKGSAKVRHGGAVEPYIVVSRGEVFADSFDTWFLAKTFPSLFPLGKGGPRQAEEHSKDATGQVHPIFELEAAAQHLVSSRNMSLEAWVKMVIQRHGGRFATHPVFPFLVFNIGVRSRNRRVSMASMRRSDFPEVERTIQDLTASRLEKARGELEACGKTADPDVNRLLRNLSLYGYRQPMSRESRLTMRRKIKSLIIRYGIPAIWFTLNPNDITNPIKLKLAAYRTRETGRAEEYLRSLDQAYKRARLAISDPLSSAIFFHREISMFFQYYVMVGKDSVFGRVSQYYGAVETNERGALHLHGLLWLQGNMYLSSLLSDVQGEEQAAYRQRVTEYVDSVFMEDLDEESFARVRAGRSVTSDVSSLLERAFQFPPTFEEEANFCAGATQIHTHSPTCVKYAIGRRGTKQNPCRFGAPWKPVEKTYFDEDGLLRLRRSHSLVNRWNKVMAVGLRHNHDISFIVTKCKGLALVYYVTNYATKVEDPVWKRVVATKELIRLLGDDGTGDQSSNGRGRTEGDNRHSQARRFLLRMANRIFTERALSQVEVLAHFQGYETELTNSTAWTFLNVCTLYWHIFRRWPLLRRAAGEGELDESIGETVLLGKAGQRISLLQAYPYRGQRLEGLALYDYMSVVKLKRKGGCVRSGEVELDRAWPLSASWIQTLRHPNQLAAVCLDGYLGMDFTEEDDSYYRRAAVQHLGLFIPWHAFLCESSGEINRIWETKKTCLSKRMTRLADNIQLLRRSAEDVARDARQWAALSGEGDPTADAVGSGSTEGHDAQGVEHRPGGVGLATRLIDVLRNAMTRKEITAGSKEISSMVEQMYRFQATALDSTDDLRATVIPDHDAHILGGSISRAEIPRQEQLRSIKSQQNGLSREQEKMIQGLQNQLGGTAAADGVAAHSGSDRLGQQDDPTTHADQRGPSRDTGPSTGVMFGASTSFCETGR
ncbi:hypothetical protein FOIG_16527 [Fusarium odoratissimum NRRL 54006]|uniref:Uncharacterized protein n=1 Tax=Fusarium odoratissimum (strain NRRL 54006) TaxID=1089451 RepID=X0JZC6_FUSO5|nr:uncharacterized protein FOIG_16527 [Fusarium odoratissimum NRRL 54006]EXL90209.1 hypothetical protein FOIG_16527 [Fusarium odoratissimum NRRL 54006]